MRRDVKVGCQREKVSFSGSQGTNPSVIARQSFISSIKSESVLRSRSPLRPPQDKNSQKVTLKFPKDRSLHLLSINKDSSQRLEMNFLQSRSIPKTQHYFSNYLTSFHTRQTADPSTLLKPTRQNLQVKSLSKASLIKSSSFCSKVQNPHQEEEEIPLTNSEGSKTESNRTTHVSTNQILRNFFKSKNLKGGPNNPNLSTSEMDLILGFK